MDGARVRGLAGLVEAAAAGVRDAAARLAGASGGSWSSVAAQEFRARLVTERGRVAGAAAGLDAAAEALRRHAAALDAHADTAARARAAGR